MTARTTTTSTMTTMTMTEVMTTVTVKIINLDSIECDILLESSTQVDLEYVMIKMII